MSSMFTIIHPVMPLDFHRLLDFINASYVLELTAAPQSGSTSYNLLIKGLPFIFHDLSRFLCVIRNIKVHVYTDLELIYEVKNVVFMLSV